MGTKLYAYEIDEKENPYDINSVYISGSVPSSQGNYALLTVPGTQYPNRSGFDVISGTTGLYGFSSLTCREVWVNLTADSYLCRNSGAAYPDGFVGVKLEQDTVYKIPVANINQFYISNAYATAYWTTFA